MPRDTPRDTPHDQGPGLPRVTVIQDGARRRYIVPLALQRAGMLQRVYTDFYLSSRSRELLKFFTAISPASIRRMSDRCCPELDKKCVIQRVGALRLRMGMYRHLVPEERYLWESEEMARWILGQGFGDADAVYGFIRNASPDIFIAAKTRGLMTAADQIIAPLDVEFEELKRAYERWPDFADSPRPTLHAAYRDFERRTWETLDAITCMSGYVRDGLIRCGVPEKKITVIPYPWHDEGQLAIARRRRDGPLVVGFVGAIGLRKGAPAFLRTAMRFDPAKVRFVMVGPIQLPAAKLREFESHVEFPGPVPRSGVLEWLAKFDVFFFPSTCEGSAGAVMEAMAAALPVLTTPNSGSQVRDGIEGFVRPWDDIDGFTQALAKLLEDRDRMLAMGQAARQRVCAYDLNAYQDDLAGFFASLVGTSDRR